MNINSKTLSVSFFWSLLEQGGSSVLSLIVQIVLARMLAPEIFGIMAILLVINGVISTIAQGGFGAALIQKKDASKTSFSTALWLSLGFAVVLYAIAFFSAPLIATLYSMPELCMYIRILAITIFLDSLNSIQRAYLQKKMQFKALFSVNFIAMFFGAIAGITLAIFNFGVWALICQAITQALIACIVMLIKTPWKPSLELDMLEGKSLFSYGWKICATGILNTFYTGLSELVIGKSCSAADLGYYSQGRKWPNAAMATINNSLQNVLFPAFSELQNNMKEFRYAIRKALISGFYITAPVCILSAIIAEPLIYFLLGESWLPCTLIFQFSCIGYTFIMPQVVNLRAYMALGLSGLYLKLQLIKVISGALFFCVVAIATKNIYIVSAAVLIHTTACILFVDMHSAKKAFGMGAFAQVKMITPTLVLSLIAALAASLINLFGFDYLPRLIIQVLIFTILYILGSALIQHEGFEDCRRILKAIIVNK